MKKLTALILAIILISIGLAHFTMAGYNGGYGSISPVTGTSANATQLEFQTWEIPGAIGSTTPNTAVFTTTTSNRYSTSGTSLSSGNFSLTAGGGGTWGVGSSVGSISGNDSGFTATVTTSGTPGLNPILTLTFAGGNWPSAPFPTCGSWVTGTTLTSNIATSTISTLALQFIGTPTTGTNYIITCPFIHG